VTSTVRAGRYFGEGVGRVAHCGYTSPFTYASKGGFWYTNPETKEDFELKSTVLARRN
jgi:hypothetical protein